MAGLDDWVNLLADRLDEALRLRFAGSDGRWAAAGAMGNDEGKEERVTLSLLALAPAQAGRNPPPRRGAPLPASPLIVDGELLVTPRRTLTTGYGEGLRALSAALEWLHANPRLTGAGQPGFAAGESVAIDQVPLTHDQVAAFIRACPTQGMPFALYRLRGMTIGA
jgi:hypothetical protein